MAVWPCQPSPNRITVILRELTLHPSASNGRLDWFWAAAKRYPVSIQAEGIFLRGKQVKGPTAPGWSMGMHSAHGELWRSTASSSPAPSCSPQGHHCTWNWTEPRAGKPVWDNSKPSPFTCLQQIWNKFFLTLSIFSARSTRVTFHTALGCIQTHMVFKFHRQNAAFNFILQLEHLRCVTPTTTSKTIFSHSESLCFTPAHKPDCYWKMAESQKEIQ